MEWRKMLSHYLPRSSLSCRARRFFRRSTALTRHLQQANIDNDSRRHSGQFGCPQSKHIVRTKGKSNGFTTRLASLSKLITVGVSLDEQDSIFLTWLTHGNIVHRIAAVLRNRDKRGTSPSFLTFQRISLSVIRNAAIMIGNFSSARIFFCNPPANNTPTLGLHIKKLPFLDLVQLLPKYQIDVDAMN